MGTRRYGYGARIDANANHKHKFYAARIELSTLCLCDLCMNVLFRHVDNHCEGNFSFYQNGTDVQDENMRISSEQ